MVIDLELAAPADAVHAPGYHLAEWDTGTLDLGSRYTQHSDMYQIGRMLQRFSALGLSVTAQQFINALLNKQLSAVMALQHPWLLQRDVPV